jgi:hypothetical protein
MALKKVIEAHDHATRKSPLNVPKSAGHGGFPIIERAFDMCNYLRNQDRWKSRNADVISKRTCLFNLSIIPKFIELLHCQHYHKARLAEVFWRCGVKFSSLSRKLNLVEKTLPSSLSNSLN